MLFHSHDVFNNVVNKAIMTNQKNWIAFKRNKKENFNSIKNINESL